MRMDQGIEIRVYLYSEIIVSPALDIVSGSKWIKCGLKYVMHTLGGLVWTSIEHTHAEQCNYASMISIS